MSNDKPLRIGICAGEASGDKLGAGLISALNQHHHSIHYVGVAGPLMRQAGCHEIFPMDDINVMGVTQVIKHLPKILNRRRQLIQHFSKNPPDIFIGIDSPDFNLPIELALKRRGVKTVHYVSPTVWAWRSKRIHKIAKAVDLMLTLFPFEDAIYQRHQVPVVCVGHPLADEIPLVIDQHEARTELGLPQEKKIVAILPGSRQLELKLLGELFLQTAALCVKKMPELQFVIPAANFARYHQISNMLAEFSRSLPVTIIQGQAQTAMAASDAVLLCSGTATLEAMLLKRPMVVAYRLSWLNWQLAKRLINVRFCSIPNLLAEKVLVDEFIQDDATVINLSDALLKWLNDTTAVEQLQTEYLTIHQMLRRGGSQRAARAVFEHLI